MKVGIAGAAGYTGGELIRILLNHPEAEIVFAHSNSQKGLPISDVHTDLLGDTDLTFSGELQDCDVLFLCMGHGASKTFLLENEISHETKVIDLSNDFRLTNQADLKSDEQREVVYGLPEINRVAIKSSNLIANPGCFATNIQLALLPLASKGVLAHSSHISAVTGSTGAGQSPSGTTHFSWRTDNLSVYKSFTHQHLGEIKQSLNQLQPGFDANVNFVPVRGDFARGIFSTIHTACEWSLEEAKEVYKSFYASHPFVHVSDKNIHLKQVVNTNKAIVYLEKHGDYLQIITVIDNLLKGASGQAVQNMNLMFGLEETTGLKLKASAF